MIGSPQKAGARVIFSHTALRGLAAMYVVFYHLFIAEGERLKDEYVDNPFCQFFCWGASAVVLFFILSGFVLHWVYLPGIDWAGYFRARVARIFPLYYLTSFYLVPIHLYSVLKHGLTYVGLEYPVNLLLNLFLVSGVVDGPFRTFNPPAWSVSVEFFCYVAVFPLLVYSNRSLIQRRFYLPLLLFVTLLFTSFLGLAVHGSALSLFGRVWKWYFLGEGVFGFSIGFYLCSLYRRGAALQPNVSVVNGTILGAIAIFLLVRFKFLPSVWLAYVLPPLVYSTAFDQGAFWKICRWAPFQWLGERSYSIYLWHSICMGQISNYLHTHSLTRAEYNGAVVLLTLCVSELSYRYFESPLRAALRERRHAVPEPQSSLS